MSQPTADQIVAEAWAAFEKWSLEHDPDGLLDPLERIEAYSKWCDAGGYVELTSA